MAGQQGAYEGNSVQPHFRFHVTWIFVLQKQRFLSLLVHINHTYFKLAVLRLGGYVINHQVYSDFNVVICMAQSDQSQTNKMCSWILSSWYDTIWCTFSQTNCEFQGLFCRIEVGTNLSVNNSDSVGKKMKMHLFILFVSFQGFLNFCMFFLTFGVQK